MNAYKLAKLDTKIQPFLKWAGGKRTLLSDLKKLGVLEKKDVYLFDKNSKLINTYKVV